MRGRPPKPAPDKHDYGTYVNWMCRCELCTAANREYGKQSREARRRRLIEAEEGSAVPVT